MNDFLMKIEYDDNMGEYFLKFIDIDDRAKKSRILKRMFQNNISTVVMTISEQAEAQTKSQRGLYDAFVILLKEYTGYSQDEVNDLLEDFYISGVFDLVGANKEYIKVHYPISDYLTRSKAKIDTSFKNALKDKDNAKLKTWQVSAAYIF